MMKIGFWVFLSLSILAGCAGSPSDSAMVLQRDPAVFQLRKVVEREQGSSEYVRVAKHAFLGKGGPDGYRLLAPPLLNASAVQSAIALKSVIDGEPEIRIVFTEEGAKQLAQITKQNLGKSIAIVIDDEIVMVSRITTWITDGVVSVRGLFSQREAERFVSKINAVLSK